MVSICGGEPLIYPHIEALINGLLGQGRIVYVCTNAMFMRKKMREWLTEELRNADGSARKNLESKLDGWIAEGLVSPKDAEPIRNPNPATGRRVVAPSPWLDWNVHLAGLAGMQDR